LGRPHPERRIGGDAIQGERTMQLGRTAAPDMTEGDLLGLDGAPVHRVGRPGGRRAGLQLQLQGACTSSEVQGLRRGRQAAAEAPLGALGALQGGARVLQDVDARAACRPGAGLGEHGHEEALGGGARRGLAD